MPPRSAAGTTVLVWVAEGTWPACVDAAPARAPADAQVVLLHVVGSQLAAAHGALAGLLGRGKRGRDPDRTFDALAASAAEELLERAAQRLGRPAATQRRFGRIEREVVAAAEGESTCSSVPGTATAVGSGRAALGADTRFVVDHAPCPVLLVWPETAPHVGSIPPPPPPGHEPPPHQRE